ncbi:LORF1 protein, partial [Crocuta crocuta]
KVKNAITEMQTQMFAIKTKMEEAGERIRDIEVKIKENNEAKTKRESKVRDHKDRLRELSDFLSCNNIHIIGVPEDEEREKGEEGSCEQIIAENFLNLGKDTDIKNKEQKMFIQFSKSGPSP